MSIAQVGQLWLATFSLDPAICRDFVQYMRALGDLLSDEQAGDDDCSVRRFSLEYLIGLGLGCLRAFNDVARRDPFEGAAPVAVRSR